MKLKLLIELEYDEKFMHNGNKDKEAKEWFYDDILKIKKKHDLFLHSNEIGCEVGTIKVLEIIK